MISNTAFLFSSLIAPFNFLLSQILRVISPEHGAEDQMGLFPNNQPINQSNLYSQTFQQYLPNGGAIVVHNAQFAQITLLGF